MDLADSSQTSIKYSASTRLFHSGLACSIIVQLLTSLFMAGPDETADPYSWVFELHEYSGLTATALALAF
jgi:cytochrome b561